MSANYLVLIDPINTHATTQLSLERAIQLVKGRDDVTLHLFATVYDKQYEDSKADTDRQIEVLRHDLDLYAKRLEKRGIDATSSRSVLPVRFSIP